MTLQIGIVAGESSGDILGAALMAAIQRVQPDVRFVGVAGPRMVEQGCEAWFPSEALAVMGLVEVLSHVRELMVLRRELVRRFRADPPDVFVGVDAPDFNLNLERQLKQSGVPTVHYVSPSVWAWRRYRTRKIARSVDLMLTLFPFESAFYETHGQAVRYVGHPLADQIPLTIDRAAVRQRLGLSLTGEIIALLPGSRLTEVRALGVLFIEAARMCLERRPAAQVIVPAATAATRALFLEQLQQHGNGLPLTVLEGHAHDALAVADVAIVASGTATLEAMLFKCPLVVAYRLAPLTYWLARYLVHTRYFSLPNLLAGERLVPELMQGEATPHALAQAALYYLEDRQAVLRLQERFETLHRQLRRDASPGAAAAILEWLGRSSGAGSRLDPGVGVGPRS